MFGIAGTAELSTFCPGTGTWNRLQDGMSVAGAASCLYNIIKTIRYYDASITRAALLYMSQSTAFCVGSQVQRPS